MKFLLFTGTANECKGGALDFRKGYDTLGEAKADGIDWIVTTGGWAHIASADTMDVIMYLAVTNG